MSTDHKTQKESYTRRSTDFFLIFFFFFLFFAFKMSVAEQFYSFAAFAREQKCSRESICVRVCMRACVRL